MKKFLDENFLLQTRTAEKLYHDHAAKMPIIDYHNHLPPQDIANGRVFSTVTEAWLEGDHYKWRAMRTNGVDERFITGKESSDEEKFMKWAETVPYTMRNPLYHWTHLELQRYFGIDAILSPGNAKEVYEETSRQLNETTACGLLKKLNVETVCTTDDPADNLEHHKKMAGGDGLKMFPAFRPDKIYAIDTDRYKDYLDKLKNLTGVEIRTYDDLIKAASFRIEYFHENGCRVSDHGLEQLYDVDASNEAAGSIFTDYLSGKKISTSQVELYKMTTIAELSRMYHSKGWVQQFHLGAIRNNSSRMVKILGPDTGFDSVGDFSQVRAMSRFLNELDRTDQLTKTILYNLNPSDNEAFVTMTGNFNDGSVVAKLQWGSAWWFLDQKDGMEKQLNALSNLGLLSRFVGMLTDSRSFLSFPRHEYFRRILCNMLGNDIENGELPNDLDWIGHMVENICYYNAKNYLDFPE